MGSLGGTARTRTAAGEDDACALHAITEYVILWVANVVIKFGTRKAPQGVDCTPKYGQ